MKKTVIAVVVIMLIANLTGCKEKDETYIVDYSNEIAEMTFKADYSEYIEAFSEFLNSDELEDIDNELISSSLIKNRMIDSQDEGEYSTEGEVGPSALGDYVAEGDDYTEEYDEYPIIDMFGDIISYGTKEESEKSFQDYDEQPYYTVMSCDMFYNTAVFKVFNKGESKIQVYEVSLNGSKQMDSYIILDIKG